MNQWNTVLEIISKWNHLGTMVTLQTKAILVGHVPHVAPEAWFHSYYPCLEESDVRELETKIGTLFPRTIKEFFSCTNGIKLFSDSLRIFGKRNYEITGIERVRQPYDIVSLNKLRDKPEDSPDSLVVVGSYSKDGSILYYLTGEETIYHSIRDSAKPLRAWSNFWIMLVEETVRLAALYDENGKKRV